MNITTSADTYVKLLEGVVVAYDYAMRFDEERSISNMLNSDQARTRYAAKTLPL